MVYTDVFWSESVLYRFKTAFNGDYIRHHIYDTKRVKKWDKKIGGGIEKGGFGFRKKTDY